jgi:glycosyltransferase involved in cell wall biosynthesis
MRIAVLTWTDRRAGGVESYLDACLPELTRLGHVVSLWHEVSVPSDRARLAAAESLETGRLDDAEGDAASALTAWRPDVVLSNGLEDAALERRAHCVAPTVFVVHNYHGTCISGTKCWSFPSRQPCNRTFGPACLALYMPRRCGGLSPTTMVRLYSQSRTRLASLRACRHLVTLSSHMRDEYLRHGFDPSRISVLPFGPGLPSDAPAAMPSDVSVARLIVIGRLERLKGVDLLVDALPHVHAHLSKPVSLTVVGDGTDASSLKERAADVEHAHPDIRVTFAGWLSATARDARLAASDLLVVPSAWPEPFGLVGLDAARLGVPAVAFDVGGVRDWLDDGVSGVLARGPIPSSRSLAEAVAGALADPVRHASLRAGCLRVAARRTPAGHAAALAGVLASAVGSGPHPPTVA